MICIICKILDKFLQAYCLLIRKNIELKEVTHLRLEKDMITLRYLLKKFTLLLFVIRIQMMLNFLNKLKTKKMIQRKLKFKQIWKWIEILIKILRKNVKSKYLFDILLIFSKIIYLLSNYNRLLYFKTM